MPRCTLFIYLFMAAAGAFAGTPLHGIVRDKTTLSPLGAANIQIRGTFQGTIANTQGRFQLAYARLPVTIKVSYIGYQSTEIVIESPPEDSISILLEPAPIMLGEMVITAEDPAVNIMRKVIAQKKVWQENLHSFAANAYSRLRVDNDTAIVLISESTSRLFWDKGKGSREIVTSVEETANFARQMGPVGSSGIPNFYDDDIIIAGYSFVGPTHKDALDFYDFELTGRLALDGKLVYDIAVKPKNERQTAFTGFIYVQAESYALLQVDLETGRAIPPAPFFPEMFFRCQQQFSSFDEAYWLPVDWRMSGALKIAMTGLSFPRMKFQYYASLSHYEPNSAVPDSLYRGAAGSRAARKDPPAGLAAESRAIPLTYEEDKAYHTVDSSMTFLKAFKPEGFLARFIKVRTGGDSVTISAGAGAPARPGWRFLQLQSVPEFDFNRVLGWRLGAGLRLADKGASGLLARGGYNSALSKWDYGLLARWSLSGKREFTLEMAYDEKARTFAGSVPYPTLMSGLASLLGLSDYHHYYWSKGWRGAIAIEPVRNFLRLQSGYDRSRHSVLETNTNWRLFNRPYRANPAAQAGLVAELFLSAKLGDFQETAGLAGRKTAEFAIEKSSPDWQSDFDYTRAQAKLEWSFRTFYSRRLFPNSLDIILSGGRTWGEVPAQRLLNLNGSLGFYAPFGSFRTLRSMPAYGEKYLAVFAEHNFRGLPFEILGLAKLAEKGIQISLHGASGRTWLGANRERLLRLPSIAAKVYHEAGFSVSGLATLFRLDVTCRLSDDHAWFLSLGLGKLF